MRVLILLPGPLRHLHPTAEHARQQILEHYGIEQCTEARILLEPDSEDIPGSFDYISNLASSGAMEYLRELESALQPNIIYLLNLFGLDAVFQGRGFMPETLPGLVVFSDAATQAYLPTKQEPLPQRSCYLAILEHATAETPFRKLLDTESLAFLPPDTKILFGSNEPLATGSLWSSLHRSRIRVEPITLSLIQSLLHSGCPITTADAQPESWVGYFGLEPGRDTPRQPQDLKRWILENLGHARPLEGPTQVSKSMPSKGLALPLPFALNQRFGRSQLWAGKVLEAWNSEPAVFLKSVEEALLGRPTGNDSRRWQVLLQLGTDRMCVFLDVFASAEARARGTTMSDCILVLQQLPQDRQNVLSYFSSVQDDEAWVFRVWPVLFAKEGGPDDILNIKSQGRAAVVQALGEDLDPYQRFIPPALTFHLNETTSEAEPLIRSLFLKIFLREAQAHEIEYFRSFYGNGLLPVMLLEGLFHSDEAYRLGLPRWIDSLLGSKRELIRENLSPIVIHASDEQFLRFSLFHSHNRRYDETLFIKASERLQNDPNRFSLLKNLAPDYSKNQLFIAETAYFWYFMKKKVRGLLRTLAYALLGRKKKWT